MNNPNSSPAPVHPLIPCVSFLSDYLRKTDRNGQDVFLGEIQSYQTSADLDVAGLCWCLIETLRTRWTVDILENSGTSHDPLHIENLEDRENSFAVLERAECFGPVAFAGEFLRLAPYILRNVHPENAE